MIVVEFIRFTVLPLNIPLTPKFPRQHKNASPSLCRLERMVDDDDGDEVNWSMEHELDRFRDRLAWVFVTSQDFKRRQKVVVLPHPCAVWRQILSQAKR